MRYLLLSACCLLLSTTAFAESSPLPQLREKNSALLTPFQSSYTVFRNGSRVGKGSQTLYTSSDGRWYFSSESRLKWFILSDYRKEQSWFRLAGHKVLPLEYQYDRTGTGPDRFSHLIFNHNEKSLQELKESYPLQAKWSEGLLDQLNYQLQLRLDIQQGKTDFHYNLLRKGTQREYRFEFLGEETLKLPIGEVETVKLRRVRSKNSSRETLIWLSKDHDYALARLWQAKDGSEQADLQLSSYTLLDMDKTN